MTPAGFARTAGLLVAVLALCTPAAAQPCPALKARNSDGNYIVPGGRADIRYSDDLALEARLFDASSACAFLTSIATRSGVITSSRTVPEMAG